MHASSSGSTSAGSEATGAEQLRTRLAPKWFVKTVVIAAGFLLLGLWGLADALVIYPKRGSTAAESFEYQYLSQLSAANSLTNTSATIADPAQTLDRLRTKQRELSGTSLPPIEKASLDWLTQLRHIGQLQPAATSFPREDFRVGDDGAPVKVLSAPERYTELKARWTAGADGKERKSQPLDWYDLPVQWVFVAVGGIVGPLMIASVLKAKTRVYRWNTQAKRLTLPTGETIEPSDIVDVDKSKWDKFYITFRVRDGHPTLSGKDLTLDLYHHVPLEDWALELEANRPGAKA
jgi:hypothetical protein